MLLLREAYAHRSAHSDDLSVDGANGLVCGRTALPYLWKSYAEVWSRRSVKLSDRRLGDHVRHGRDHQGDRFFRHVGRGTRQLGLTRRTATKKTAKHANPSEEASGDHHPVSALPWLLQQAP